MKTVIFKKDHEFWAKNTVTTLDDTLADQYIKAKIVSLAPSSQPELVEGNNEENTQTPAE